MCYSTKPRTNLFASKKSPCRNCGEGTILSVCITCLKIENDKEIKTIDKKNNNIVDMGFKDITKIKLKKNDKIPANCWTSKNNQSKNYKPTANNNIGLVCNKESGIIGIDLDFYTKTLKDGTVKKYDPVNIPEHKVFVDTFGKDFIKTFDTLTQKTTNGGVHLIFKHDDEIKQTQNEHYNIDIRGGNTNGYLVGAGSVVNGKQYKLVNDTSIKPFPDNLKKFLLDNLYGDVPIDEKKTKRGIKKVKKDKKDIQLNCEYKYLISETREAEIFVERVITWIQASYTNWVIFGSAMKQIDRYDLFDKYSKLDTAKYDKSKNDQYYQNFSNSEGTATYFEFMIKNAFMGKDNTLLDIFGEKSTYILGQNIISNIKYKPTEKDKSVPDKIINIDKLGKGFDIDKNQNYIIKSDTGTGKTTLFKNYIKSTQQNFISVVSRRTLAKEQYDDFVKITDRKCLYYEHYGKGKGEMPKDEQGLVICFDSLMKIKEWNLSDKVIFLDEFNSIIEHFISTPTMKDKRVDCLEIFLKIFQEAKQIICVDADISDLCINFIKDILVKNYDFQYVKNIYNHNQNKKCQQYNDFEPFMKKIHDSEAFMVCCDSKARAIEISDKYYEKHPDKEVLLIVADNIKEVEFEKLDEYPRVIFSPKIIYGLDSNFVGGRDVFCYYEGKTISPSNMVQQINRERNINTLHYFFPSNNFVDQAFQTQKELELSIHERNKAAISIIKCEYEDWVEAMYLKMLETYEYKQDCYHTNKKIHFQQILYSRGFSEIEEISTSNHVLATAQKMMEQKYITIQKYGEEQFCVEDVINNRLNTDILKIFNTNDLRKSSKIFTDDYEFARHINYCSYFHNDLNGMKDKFESMNDFAINKIGLDELRIINILELQEKFGFDKLLNTVDNTKIDFLPSEKETIHFMSKFWYNKLSSKTPKNRDEWRGYMIEVIEDILGHDTFNKILDSKQVRTPKPKKKDYSKKSRMTKEEKIIYEKAIKEYEKLPERYTKYSLNKRYQKKSDNIFNYRKEKPSILYSQEKGFEKWRETVFDICEETLVLCKENLVQLHKISSA